MRECSLRSHQEVSEPLPLVHACEFGGYSFLPHPPSIIRPSIQPSSSPHVLLVPLDDGLQLFSDSHEILDVPEAQLEVRPGVALAEVVVLQGGWEEGDEFKMWKRKGDSQYSNT